MALALFGNRPPLSIAAQLAQTPPVLSVDLDGVGNVAVAKWRSRRFVDEALLTTKGSRGRTSWISGEGFYVRELGASNALGKVLWVCRYCDQKGSLERLYGGRATTSPIDHLNHKHHVTSSSADDDTTASDTPGSRAAKRQRRMVGLHEKQILEELALGYIVSSDNPFDALNNPYLERLLFRLNSDVVSNLSLSRSSMRRSLATVFALKKDIVRMELASALTQIHLAFDLWTSPNGHAILGVSGHFISSAGKPEQRLLALCQQRGRHSGDAIGLMLSSVVRDWEISGKLGVLISDNASSNDRAGETLYSQVSSHLDTVDVQHRRIRYYGHILNLVGRAFLYGEDGDSLEQESQVYESQGDMAGDLRLWRRQGPVGKLHNIIKWVRASPQRSEYFRDSISQAVSNGDDYLLHEQTSFELQLILNNDTRWNSTYLMIERALQKQAQIQNFLAANEEEADPQRRLPAEDNLTFEDWRLLVELQDILRPLYQQTLRTQGWARDGSHGALWEIMGGMEFLLEKMESWKTLFNEEINGGSPLPEPEIPSRQRRSQRGVRPAAATSVARATARAWLDDMTEESRRYFRLSVTNGWTKLSGYYKRLEDSPLYAAAVILHPRYTIEWLEDHWTDDHEREWVVRARSEIRKYWRDWYAETDDAMPSSQLLVPLEMEALPAPGPSEFDDWMGASRSREPTRELEIDRYLALKPSPVQNPIEWWLGHREEFPTVSQFALDILAIPAMAADCERAFSLAKLTLTSQRQSMKPETLEHLQCLKNWLSRGAVSLGTTPRAAFAMPSASPDHGTPPELED